MTYDAQGANSNVEISKRLLMINTLSTACVTFANMFIFVWLYQYLIKRLPDEEYALLPLVGAVVLFVPLFTTILCSGTARFSVEAFARNDLDRVTSIVTTSAFIISIISPLMLVVGCWVAYRCDLLFSVDKLYVDDLRKMLLLTLGGAVIQICCSPFIVGFHMRQKFVLLNGIQVIGQVVRMVVLLLLLFTVSTKVLWVAVATFAGNMTAQILQVVCSLRLHNSIRFKTSAFDWPLAKTLMSFNSWSLVNSLAELLRNGADVFILNRFTTAHELNSYHLGTIPYRQSRVLPQFVLKPLGPALTAMHATDDKKRIANVYLRGGRHGLWAIGVIAGPMVAFSTEAMNLYVGTNYVAAPIVMMTMLAPLLMSYGNLILGPLALARNRMAQFACQRLAMQVVNVLLTIYLVKYCKLGAVGCAASTASCAAVGLLIFYFPLGLKIANVSFSQWLRETVIPGYIPLLGGAAVWIGLKLLVRPQSWTTLIICCLAGQIVFALITYTRCFKPEDHGDFSRVASLLKSAIRRK